MHAQTFAHTGVQAQTKLKAAGSQELGTPYPFGQPQHSEDWCLTLCPTDIRMLAKKEALAEFHKNPKLNTIDFRRRNGNES